jgi:hypothetical protein
MPMTYAEHEKKLKSPAVCELLPLRDLPNGDNVMVRTNGAFVAGYELRGILALPIPHKKAGTNHLIHHPLRRNFGAQTPQS